MFLVELTVFGVHTTFTGLSPAEFDLLTGHACSEHILVHVLQNEMV